MQQLTLLSVGVGLAWATQRLVERAAAGPPDDSKASPGTENGAQESNIDEDFEKRATQWLARKAFSVGGAMHGDTCVTPLARNASSYSEVELLVDGELVYLRCGSNVLTAMVPTVRRLTLQPLQLARGRPDAVPTAPLDPKSVWRVRRCKQQVTFELLGPQGQLNVLEADPGSPHGVALGGSHINRRGRWHITPQGLTSARWSHHVLPLQVLPVHLVDARALSSLKASLARQLAEQTARAENEARERLLAEARRAELELQLCRVRDEGSTKVAELRAQLETAVRCRHAAEREMSALQAQRTDEAARAKASLSKAAQAEHEARQLEGTIRQLQKQIQGLLAEHSEELSTLRQELQIAREANEGLQRAMKEQVLALHGELELRDARILELEEENERMDTVLQAIQEHLGSASLSILQHSALGLPRAESAPPIADGARGSRQPAAPAAAGTQAEAVEEVASCSVTPGSRRGGYADADAAGAGPSPFGYGGVCLAAGERLQDQVAQRAQGGADAGQPLPLWRSLLDLPGGLTVTALKESLAVSRRSTAESALAMFPSAEPILGRAGAPTSAAPPAQGGADGMPRGPVAVEACSESRPAESAGNIAATKNSLRAWPFPLSPDRASSVGSSDGHELTAWGSRDAPTGTGGVGGSDGEGEFISAAARMGGTVRTPGPSPAAAASVSASASAGTAVQAWLSRVPDGGAASGAGRLGNSEPAGAPPSALTADCAAPSRSHAAAVATSDKLLTLDSLRRRMRALDSERQRLHLLSCSLEGSLPWRASGADAGRGTDGGGIPVHGSGVQQWGSCLDTGMDSKADDGVAVAARRRTADAAALTPGVQGWLEAATEAAVQLAGASRAAALAGSPGCGLGAVAVGSLATADRPLSALGAGAARDGSTSVSFGCRVPQPPSSNSSDAGQGLEVSGALQGLLAHGPDGLLSSPGNDCLQPRTSAGVDAFQSENSTSGSTPESPGQVQSAEGSGDGASSPSPPAATQPPLPPAPAAASAAAGRWVPELRLNRPGLGNGANAVGVLDSIDLDGMCNLGSTRAAPTARGGAGGALTARHFSHSRRPSAGVGGGDTPLLSPSGRGDAVDGAAVATPAVTGVPQAAPGSPPGVDGASPSAAGQDGVPLTTPPAGNTPHKNSGAGELTDDDATVHCDDQEGSPPVAMLLGPLEALRSATNATEGEGGSGACGGLRVAKRGLAALEEEDDDDDDE